MNPVRIKSMLGMELRHEDQYAVAGARADQDNFNAIIIPPLAGTGLESQIATYLTNSGLVHASSR